MYGTHYTGNKYMLLDAPDGDGVLVNIRMMPANAKKFRKQQEQLLQKHTFVHKI